MSHETGGQNFEVEQAIAACRMALGLQPDFKRAKVYLASAEQKLKEMGQ